MAILVQAAGSHVNEEQPMLIDGTMMCAGGVLMLLVGSRVIQLPSSPRFDSQAWHQKHGWRFRLGGGFTLAVGLGFIVAAAVS